MNEIEWKTLKRVVSDGAGEDEMREVEAWGRESPEHVRFLDDARQYYGSLAPGGELSARDVDRAWEKVKPGSAVRRLPIRRALLWTGAAAAALALVVGIGRWWPDSGLTSTMPLPAAIQLVLADGSVHQIEPGSPSDPRIPGFTVDEQGALVQVAVAEPRAGEPVSYNEIVVPRSGEHTITLSDGTRIVLNSESKLRFPATFGGSERKVYLSGEAYFDVTHDAGKPFIVDMDGVEVCVLGTQFNVKAYGCQTAWVTLVEGSVKVSAGDEQRTLVPGLQCRIEEGSRALSLHEADLLTVLAWKNGEFVFKDVALGEMMDELARWYDVEVEYARESLAQLRFYIYVERSATLEEVLDKIARTDKIDYKINGRKVTISLR